MSSLPSWLSSHPLPHSIYMMVPEFFGTLAFTCVVFGASGLGNNFPLTVVGAYMGLLTVFGQFGSVSFNPIITVAQTLLQHIGALQCFCIIAAQMWGAMVGAAILDACTGDVLLNNLNVPTLSVDQDHGFGFEVMTAFFLVLLFLICFPDSRSQANRFSIMYYTFAVGAATYASSRYTNSRINPAVQFGLASIADSFDDHWVFWIGPLTGSVAATIIYTFMQKMLSVSKQGESTDC